MTHNEIDQMLQVICLDVKRAQATKELGLKAAFVKRSARELTELLPEIDNLII